MYNGVTLLYHSELYNIVVQLFFNKNKKRLEREMFKAGDI